MKQKGKEICMDNVTKLQTSYDIGIKKAAKQYAYTRGATLTAYSAVAVCGLSLAVFLFKGADDEVVASSYARLSEYFKSTNMLTGSLQAFVPVFVCAIICFFAGFSITPSLYPHIVLALNGFIGGGIACLMYKSGELYVCISYVFSFLLSSLALALFATEAQIFRKNNLEQNRCVKDILSVKFVFSYMSLFAVPLSLLMASSMLSFVLPSLITKYAVKF